jgi:hypothetical protein
VSANGRGREATAERLSSRDERWPVCSANARGLLPGKLARKNNRPHFLNVRQAEDTAARLTLGC